MNTLQIGTILVAVGLAANFVGHPAAGAMLAAVGVALVLGAPTKRRPAESTRSADREEDTETEGNAVSPSVTVVNYEVSCGGSGSPGTETR